MTLSAKNSRSPRVHVYIIDGTLSRLTEGRETNAGLLYKLLSERGPRVEQAVGYDPGIQGSGLQKWIKVAAGLGINDSIKAGYSAIASRYEPGDTIMLFGYSRGAYAVRSIAGFIGRIGLLKRTEATQRRIDRAFRHYEALQVTQSAQEFTAAHCHRDVPIAFIGVWDTVKALGLPYPILNRLAPMATEFHDHSLGPNIQNAYQALAIDENRSSYQPMPWRTAPDWGGQMEQVWFPGAHPDIGGKVTEKNGSRTFSNISFVWMLNKAMDCGLHLPDGWEGEFPRNVSAPMHGAYAGGAQYFMFRHPRVVGLGSNEAIHHTVFDRMKLVRKYIPVADVRRITNKLKVQASDAEAAE